MLKKISIISVALFLFGCAEFTAQKQHTNITYKRTIDRYEFQDEEYERSQKDIFHVAMLLSLSGKASSYGKGMQNAAMMAIEDTNNNNLEIRFYDTKSTPTGAVEAFYQARSNNAQLILGPITAEEVSSIAPLAKRENVPVISFSTSPQVLEEGIYTIGLLSDEQINRIISYASHKDRKRIALIVPDSNAGLNMARSAFEAANQNGMTLVKIGFYEPSTLEFSELIKKMIANKNFDTVLIAETGSRLKAIAATFGYYDTSYPEVLFVGTSIWENTNLSKETTLYHGLYPAISRVHNDYFNQKYKDLFGQTPNNLYAYAYDGVALASALSAKGKDDLNQYITSQDGYIGINGIFRIKRDGTNEHSLDIIEVSADGIQVVETAQKSFQPEIYHMPVYTSQLPEIYGKNAEVVYQKLVPAKQNYFMF